MSNNMLETILGIGIAGGCFVMCLIPVGLLALLCALAWKVATL